MNAATAPSPTSHQKTELILAQLDGLAVPSSLASLLSGADEPQLFKVVTGIFDARSDRGVQRGLDPAGLWKHALAVGCAARGIAEEVSSSISAGQAFAAGLLHDIGKTALDYLLPKSYLRIVQLTDAERADIADIERAILGIDHTTAGRRLGLHWGLPLWLVDCIWLHHQDPAALPASVAPGRHVQIIQLADALARFQQLGYSGNYHAPPSASALAAIIGLQEDALRALASALAKQVEARIAWIDGNDRTASQRMGSMIGPAETDDAVPARPPRRQDDYFAAIGRFHQSITANLSTGDSFCRAAEAVSQALRLDAVLVFTCTGRQQQFHVGLLSQGAAHYEVLERIRRGAQQTDQRDQEADQRVAQQSAMAGCWIAAPGRSMADLLDRYGSQLGHAESWLLPILVNDRWVGGALFRADSSTVAELLPESELLRTLSGAIGMVLLHAHAQAEAVALTEDLAAANRRLASMQAEAVRRRNLETVVAMAAGAAHELNNPLAVISGRAQVLRDQAPNEPLRTQLDAIVRQAQAASDIVTELMEFAQPRAPAPGKVCLKEVLAALSAELGSAGLLAVEDLALNLPSDTPPVWFDPDNLAGVFRELLHNAIEATPAGERRLTVKARPDLTEDFLVVQVSDNGRGMTPEVLGRAMDPFFSYRPAGRGRGLGLARALRWLANGDAAIWIESTPSAGTSVKLRLPTRPAKGG